MQETQETEVRSLGREDPLALQMASRSSCLAWETLWTEEPGKLTVHGGHKELDATEHTHALKYSNSYKMEEWLKNSCKEI